MTVKYIASNYGSIGTLDAPINSSATEFDVTGSSIILNDLVAGEAYLLCLGNPAGTREFIQCTSFSADHFAGVTRGFEPTKDGQDLARSWPSGTPVQMVISAAYLDNIVQKGDWDNFPKGYMQPFIESVMGLDISAWLALHTKWSRIIDVPFIDLAGTIPGTDLLGRAMAVASGTHGPMDRAGSDDAVVVSHSHTSPPHNHGILTCDSQDASGYLTQGNNTPLTGFTTDNATVTIDSAGVSGTDKNIQRTIYLDWIIKVLD